MDDKKENKQDNNDNKDVNIDEEFIAAQLLNQELVDDNDPAIRAALDRQRLKLGNQVKHHQQGGLVFTNTKILAFQRRVVYDFIKEVSWSFASGKKVNLVKISLPVKIFEPRSFLQRMSDGWKTAPTLLGNAYAAKDPIERMKWVVTFAISALGHTVKQWKPFNPILGETYEGAFKGGTKFYVEQTSHHPPVTHWQLFGPDNAFHYYGYAKFEGFLRGNAVKGKRLGPNIITFNDGTKITYTLPDFWLRGILWGERIAEYLGDMTFTDKKNDIQLNIKFNPDAIGYIQSFFYSAESPTDIFRGDITQKGVKVSTCSGSWLGDVRFDDKLYLDTKKIEEIFSESIKFDNPLPSDCRYREDLQALDKGDYKLAQSEKVRLEEIQRNDRKLRAKYGPDATTH